MKKVLVLSAFVLVLAPFIAHGQNFEGINGIVEGIQAVIKALLPIVGALALLYFFWGLAKFILAAGDEEAREKGKSIMIWGIVALFIIVSVWGLVAWLGTLLGIEAGSNVTIPNIVT